MGRGELLLTTVICLSVLMDGWGLLIPSPAVTVNYLSILRKGRCLVGRVPPPSNINCLSFYKAGQSLLSSFPSMMDCCPAVSP